MGVAFVFPGQGSQQIGMGKFLLENFPKARQVFEEASDALSFDLKKLCLEGPEDVLTLTENTQPALLTNSLATWACLSQEVDLKPAFAAGHSVGEYPALVAAGAMKLSEAARAVRARGQAMQRAVPEGVGGMCAVLGATDEYVTELCKWALTRHEGRVVLEPANFNAPGQVVVSGHLEVLEDLRLSAKEAPIPNAPTKLRIIPLKVSAPFHCSLMQPAQDEMRDVLEECSFSAPKFPVVQNVVATPVDNPEWHKLHLIQQMTGSVRWTESVRRLYQDGVTTFVELGSGKVLTGLGKKILEGSPAEFLSTTDAEDFKTTVANLQNAN